MSDFLLLKCGVCGWVHAGITGDEPENKGADLASPSFRRCFRCHASRAFMAPCSREDVPRGVTIQPVLWPP